MNKTNFAIILMILMILMILVCRAPLALSAETKSTDRQPARVAKKPAADCSPIAISALTAQFDKLNPADQGDFDKGGALIPTVAECISRLNEKKETAVQAMTRLLASAGPFDGTTDIADGFSTFLQRKATEAIVAKMLEDAKAPDVLAEACHRQFFINTVYGRTCTDQTIYPNCANIKDSDANCKLSPTASPPPTTAKKTPAAHGAGMVAHDTAASRESEFAPRANR